MLLYINFTAQNSQKVIILIYTSKSSFQSSFKTLISDNSDVAEVSEVTELIVGLINMIDFDNISSLSVKKRET